MERGAGKEGTHRLFGIIDESLRIVGNVSCLLRLCSGAVDGLCRLFVVADLVPTLHQKWRRQKLRTPACRAITHSHRAEAAHGLQPSHQRRHNPSHCRCAWELQCEGM